MDETYQKYRRGLLKGALAGAAAPVLAAGKIFNFQPDAKAVIAGKFVPIDVALLGNKGEATAGFYASLDPFHGYPFSAGWNAVYGHYFDNPRTTDPAAIERVVTHVTVHGVKRQDLFAVYENAKKLWDDRPALRENTPRP